MTELEDEVWDDPVHNVPRILVSHRRAGATEGALIRAVRTRAEMWNSRLAESIEDSTADAVVVALDLSTPQGLRRKRLYPWASTMWLFYFYFCLLYVQGAN
jgi:hypothetical protein